MIMIPLSVQISPAYNDKNSPEHIFKQLDDPNWSTRHAAIWKTNATLECVLKALSDDHYNVRLVAEHKLKNWDVYSLDVDEKYR